MKNIAICLLTFPTCQAAPDATGYANTETYEGETIPQFPKSFSLRLNSKMVCPRPRSAQAEAVSPGKRTSRMEECLTYFRRAIGDPLSVPPWSEWWAENAERVERSFPLVDFVRLKHRRLLGARQILQKAGELPADYAPPSPLLSGSCAQCGERTINHSAGPGGGCITCPTCGIICTYDNGFSPSL